MKLPASEGYKRKNRQQCGLEGPAAHLCDTPVLVPRALLGPLTEAPAFLVPCLVTAAFASKDLRGLHYLLLCLRDRNNP